MQYDILRVERVQMADGTVTQINITVRATDDSGNSFTKDSYISDPDVIAQVESDDAALQTAIDECAAGAVNEIDEIFYKNVNAPLVDVISEIGRVQSVSADNVAALLPTSNSLQADKVKTTPPVITPPQ